MTPEQIIKKFEKILYEELTAKVKRSWHNNSILYLIDKKGASIDNKKSFTLIIGIQQKNYNLFDINISLFSSSEKHIFDYHYSYSENEINNFFIVARKILQLINSKLSKPKIRKFYQENGLLEDATDKKIINKDIEEQRNKIFNQIKKYNIIHSNSYIQTRKQLLLFKIIQLVKQYIKKEYKNKIYIEQDMIYIKILDTNQVTLNLGINYSNEDLVIEIIIFIRWGFEHRRFEANVGIMPTINENEVLDQFIKGAILFFNELDDYVKLKQKNF